MDEDDRTVAERLHALGVFVMLIAIALLYAAGWIHEHLEGPN